MSISDKALYQSVFTIRHCEEAIKKYYFEDEMRTPMHMSAGEEAIVAGVCGALDPADPVFGTYRSHGLFLAKTGDINSFFAEMYGRETGCNKGISGSMHLSFPEKGLMLCAAIVASTIPLAVGAAFAEKYTQTGRVCAVFFGDGATEEGVFWESVNAACVMQLPVLFVCEDNGLAAFTSAADRVGHTGLPAVLEKYHMQVSAIDSTDAREVCESTRSLLSRMRENSMPGFLHARYYRYLEHVGVLEDFDLDYRSRKDYEHWLERDPVAVMRSRLLESGMTESALEDLENALLVDIDQGVKKAQAAALLPEEEALKGVYACE